ncbi:MAG: hypothetical protein AMDU4_FER2C00008G0005 [Ferroplasma sp. Type II]|uniref:hypothetical protein n=1 Tax=Ferroplasma sp. Type II TaxID=261388 RepID=UPI0003896B07|nr:hypothetical protein [Ferroplasma sp. Type II]EQB74433.1 MAG: hypothetical protein AMDU4_FER2C00008G0005 [Ferroplasma sp. Type II]
MSLLIALIVLLIAIAILSIPMYIASLIIVNKSTATFGSAVVATVITALILVFLSIALHFLLAPLAVFGTFLAFLITLFIILYAYSSIYDISMARSFILAVMEVIIWFVFFIFTGILGAFFLFI